MALAINQEDNDPFPEAKSLFQRYGINEEDILDDSIDNGAHESEPEDLEVEKLMDMGQSLENNLVIRI